MDNTSGSFPLLRILVLIVNADRASKVSGVFKQLPPHLQYQFHADGIATSEMLDIFGLGVMEKVVTICVLPEINAKPLLQDVLRNFLLHLPGNGVAFTIPVSGITGQALTLIDSDNNENEVAKMKPEIEHHLIVAAVNKGYSDAIVDTAKQAGATGGTVWSARRAELDEPLKLLGVPMQGEQEIIAMLVAKDKKLDIMKAINEKHGIASEAQGIILSLPVDNVIGLDKKGDSL